MSWRAPAPMAAWAARDLLRRPGEVLLQLAALAAVVAVVALPLLVTRSLSWLAAEALEQGPALVVRRVTAQGWAPLPAAEAVAAATSITGVTAAEVRVWGLAQGPAGAVTVRALDPKARALLEQHGLGSLPHKGQALVGDGVSALGAGDPLPLVAASSMTFTIAGKLPPQLSSVAHDSVLVGLDDARQLLGLAPELASDLALQVFHDGEAQALLPELSEAFPWPVQIVTRAQALGSYQSALFRRGSLASLAAVPALLAIALLALLAAKERLARAHEVALLRAMGWQVGDIAWLCLWRALLVVLPALALGLACACAAVFWPGQTWVATLLLGWDAAGPPLALDPAAAAPALLQAALLVGAPWLCATLAAALRLATAEPQQLLERGGEQ